MTSLERTSSTYPLTAMMHDFCLTLYIGVDIWSDLGYNLCSIISHKYSCQTFKVFSNFCPVQVHHLCVSVSHSDMVYSGEKSRWKIGTMPLKRKCSSFLKFRAVVVSQISSFSMDILENYYTS